MHDITKEILVHISFDIAEFYENLTNTFHFRFKWTVQRRFYLKIWVCFCVYLGVYQTTRCKEILTCIRIQNNFSGCLATVTDS
jgi:hypothetical protein